MKKELKKLFGLDQLTILDLTEEQSLNFFNKIKSVFSKLLLDLNLEEKLTVKIVLKIFTCSLSMKMKEALIW